MTDHQKEILREIRRGRTVKEIAEEMGQRPKSIYESIAAINARVPHLITDVNFLIENGFIELLGRRVMSTLPEGDVKRFWDDK